MIKNAVFKLGDNPPPPLQLHASLAVHQSPQQGAPPLQCLWRQACHLRKNVSRVQSKQILLNLRSAVSLENEYPNFAAHTVTA